VAISTPIGQDGGKVVAGPYSYECLGYVQITGLSGAGTLPALAAAAGVTIPQQARMALIAVSVQGVRWRDDGGAPTASIGMPRAAGQEFAYTGDLSALQLIQQASGAVLDVSFYK
jgi:hypothetical protein